MLMLRLLLALGLVVGSVRVAHADRGCILEVKGTALACVAQCRDDFRSAKFACRGVDATCGKACLAGRQVCADAADAVCDACVDAAQVTAFVCRDGCRESWRTDATVKSLLASCRSSFRACVAACPKS
jgi:hypothetical protein